MDHLFGLAPSADWIVGPTSENGLKPILDYENKLPVVAFVADNFSKVF
jgi:hypothetical protein